jgi:CubicO group peptidase (beta-lactamase class C family)
MTKAPRPRPDDVDQLARVVDDHRLAQRVPGMSVAVVRGGEPVWSYATGTDDLAQERPFSVGTACHWFSMTKIATVTAAMGLVDQGQLDLDAPVTTYLTDVLPPAFARVRVVHLAQHAAGLRNPLPLRWVHGAGAPVPDQRAFLARHLRARAKPRFEPGSRAAYSNLSTVVLGEVIAAVTGTTYVEHVRDEVLRPLEMDHTGFTYADVGSAPRAVGYQPAPRALDPLLRAFFPQGIVGARCGRFLSFEPFEMDAPACSGLIGPVTDAGRFLTAHTAATSVMSRASAARMQEITVRGKPYDLGLGWFRPHGAPPTRDDDEWVQHYGGGGGFWNVLRVYPRRDVGVAVMGNTTRRWDVDTVADVVAAFPW